MTAWLADPRLVDLALLLTAIEAVAVVWWHRTRRRGIPPREFLGNLLSGVCLMLALRVALGGAGRGWIAIALAGALVAHVVDLARRWR